MPPLTGTLQGRQPASTAPADSWIWAAVQANSPFPWRGTSAKPSAATPIPDAGHRVDNVEVWFEEKNAGFVEVFVRDIPAHFPFFITYTPPRAEHRATQGITVQDQPDLTALLLRSTEPEADARLLADLIGCPVNGSTVALPGAEVRFEHGATTGLYGIAVHGLDASTAPADIAGMTVAVEPR